MNADGLLSQVHAMQMALRATMARGEPMDRAAGFLDNAIVALDRHLSNGGPLPAEWVTHTGYRRGDHVLIDNTARAVVVNPTGAMNKLGVRFTDAEMADGQTYWFRPARITQNPTATRGV